MMDYLAIKKELREIAVAGDSNYTVAANVIAELVEQVKLGTPLADVTPVLDDIASKFKTYSASSVLYAQLVDIIKTIKN